MDTFKLELDDTAPRGKGRAWVSKLPDKEFVDRLDFELPAWHLPPGTYIVHSPKTATTFERYGLYVRQNGTAKRMTMREAYDSLDPNTAKSVTAAKVGEAS